MSRHFALPLIPLLFVSLGAGIFGQDAPSAVLPDAWADQLPWRSIGPATMGGRITALAVYESDPSTWFAATASGGLLKTTNNGTTLEHQFDREAVVSIGDVAVAPSDKNVVWVGTGESNPRNSVSYGNGVYKSVDGGKTWKHMGLKGSFQIGRVRIHPTDPDIVYVGALGRLYGPNEERGLYKTTDGGETWSKVLYVDDRTGVIELAMHPTDPEILLAATYERERDGFDANDPAKRWGPGGGLHKTTDGGKTWRRITAGLPTGQLGRIGLDWYRADPSVVFALVESDSIGKQPEDAPFAGLGTTNAEAGARVTEVSKDGPAARAGIREDDVVLAVNGEPVGSQDDLDRLNRRYGAGDTVTYAVSRKNEAMKIDITFAKLPKDARSPFGTRLGGQVPGIQDRQGPDGHEFGGLFRSGDGGETWTRINSINPRPMYFSQVRVDPQDENVVWVLGVSLERSLDGGRTFARADRGVHADHHAMWIDPGDGRHVILGNDGGIYVTYDRGEHWDHLNHVAIGQFYHVATGPRRNYWVYGGLQDNGTWGGPSRTSNGGSVNENWIRVGGGDGFICRVDPDDPSQVYFESQNGGLASRHLEKGAMGRISPRVERGVRVRFNWETPFLLSHHNPRIYYTAGHRVFRSLNRGERLVPISPEITKTERGSASALAESPLDPDILYVGTDDGALWVTRDGGAVWHDCWLAPEMPLAQVDEAKTVASSGDVDGAPRTVAASEGTGDERSGPQMDRSATARRRQGAEGAAGAALATLLPGARWVSEVVASSAKPERAYVTFDAHRSNDDLPYVLMTEDAGRTWHPLTENLPEDAGPTRTIAEDPINHDLLYLGTEFGAFVSLDRGQHWTRLRGALPTVAVHAFAIHPTSGEVVAGTHGRSLWVADVSWLRQVTPDVLAAPSHLFSPMPAVIWKRGPSTGGTLRRFRAENPQDGATLDYSLAKKADDVRIEILDHTGRTIRVLEGPKEPGLHRVLWDLRLARPEGDGGRGRRRARRAPRVGPGTYGVRLTVDGRVHEASVAVAIDPDHPDGNWLPYQDLSEDELFTGDEHGDEEEESEAAAETPRGAAGR